MKSANSTAPKAFFGNRLTLRQLPTNRLALAAILVLAVVVVGFSMGALSAGTDGAAQQPAAKALPVRTVAIQPAESYESLRSYTGEIVARRTSDLAFERSDELIAIHVDLGDRVQNGDVLAELDSRRLQAKQRELVARRSAELARLEEMIAGPRSEQIAAARAQVANQKAKLEQLQHQLHRRVKLLESRAISREDYDNTLHQKEAAAAAVQEAEHRLEELTNGTRKEQVAAQRALVAQIDALLVDVKIQIADSRMTAPFAGTIAARHADEGTIVSPGNPVLRLVEDAALEAWIGVPAETAASLETGREMKVHVGRATHDAKVSGKLPEVDPATRTQTVILAFDATTARRLVTGQIARLAVPQRIDVRGFWLPNTALIQGERGLWSVYVAQPQQNENGAYRAERGDVEILYTESDRVLVRGTVEPGDLVVTSGVMRIVPGQAVVSSE